MTALYKNQNSAMEIDTPEQVAEKIAELIRSEEAEAKM
jgi:hypothetical protein